MKHNTLNIAKGFFLLLFAVALLFASVGSHHVSGVAKANSAKKEKTKKGEKQEEQVSVAPALEAIVVSILHPDFTKDILFIPFDFSILSNEVAVTAKRILISEKYLSTLFTHIISPNAP